MRKSGDTLLRQWQLLRLLPPYPRKKTAGDLQTRLGEEGYRTTKRSVERDLHALSEMFAIVVDDREKPYGWSWQKDAPILDVPGLTMSQALTFALVQRYLEPLLPSSLVNEIGPYFKAAAQQLSARPKRRGIPSWTEKIRVIHPAQTLRPPKINRGVQSAIYDALLNDRQVNLVYHRRGGAGPVEYTAHILGIVQRGPVFYIVCTLFRYQDVRLLALHRILSATLLAEEAVRPKDFDLDEYIQQGALDFGVGKKVRLEALFTVTAAEHLHETPLSDDQTIVPADEGWVRVSATVNDTPQLAWWLLAFGEQVEVLKPAGLRKDMAASAAAMARNYRKRRNSPLK